MQNELQNVEASSFCSPIEICMQKLRRTLGHVKGRFIPTIV